MGGELADGQRMEGGSKLLHFKLSTGHKWGLPVVIIGSNVSINDLEDGIKCTLTKFANDTKLRGEVDTLEGRAFLQKDLHRLEEWANKNPMKFNKNKVNVLHLGKHNPWEQHRMGSTQLGRISVGRALSRKQVPRE